MKLRNKKTGEIVEAESCNSYTGTIGLFFEKGRETDRAYGSLAELNEEWEDYKPAEPLIKDEKIRKAVRAWADANDFERLEVTHSRKHTLRVMDENLNVEIFFFRKDGMPEIDERVYSLSELCGEEKE